MIHVPLNTTGSLVSSCSAENAGIAVSVRYVPVDADRIIILQIRNCTNPYTVLVGKEYAETE